MFTASAESLFLKHYKTAAVLRILCSWASTGSQKTLWNRGLFRAGPRNAPKWSPIGFLVAISTLGPEMLQKRCPGGFLGAFSVRGPEML